MKPQVTLLDIRMSDEGHRSAYADFFSRIYKLERQSLRCRSLLSRKPVLVPMIEESFGIFTLVAVIRAMLRRPTAGLLFRPRPALEGKSIRLRLKYKLLRFLKRLPSVSVLTIMPFSVEPRFAEIATGWIHDPQLWDLTDAQITLDRSGSATATKLRDAAHGRRICVALGRQDASKGFAWFSKLYARSGELRKDFLFAFGGKVTSTLLNDLSAFVKAGGFDCNRFISDEELFDFYASADAVWCAYDSSYDQASGIFGRAVQLGIPPIVRYGSLVQRLCAQEDIPHVAVNEHRDWQDVLNLPAREPESRTRARTQRMRDESLINLHAALGVA